MNSRSTVPLCSTTQPSQGGPLLAAVACLGARVGDPPHRARRGRCSGPGDTALSSPRYHPGCATVGGSGIRRGNNERTRRGFSRSRCRRRARTVIGHETLSDRMPSSSPSTPQTLQATAIDQRQRVNGLGVLEETSWDTPAIFDPTAAAAALADNPMPCMEPGVDSLADASTRLSLRAAVRRSSRSG